jgi:hypothetical protein
MDFLHAFHDDQVELERINQSISHGIDTEEAGCHRSSCFPPDLPSKLLHQNPDKNPHEQTTVAD